ncbi:unnamed protein product [Cylicocyclus nassatus]|uniref:Uncharacterized protein n=1 Tax=Cylicocyclus nassatus TaxID=53992 RepID=A0AA36MEQ0_CYLNA|nr:unnamed protein product [Cylicocyclus nassatus]
MRRNIGQGWLPSESLEEGERTGNRVRCNEQTANGSVGFLGALRKSKLSWNGLFLLVLIFGAALSVILTVAFASKKTENNPRVMYFSMFLGDEDPSPTPRLHSVLEANDDKNCSLRKNVENTKKAIEQLAKTKLEQKYSFILYGDKVLQIGPLKAVEAAHEVQNIKATHQNGSSFNQIGAIETFLNKKGTKDILMHYIPCKFTYSANDSETTKFVQMMKDSGLDRKTTLVSNTVNATVVAETFQIDEEDIKNMIIDKDQSVAERIEEIGSKEEEKTTSSATKPTPTIVPSPTMTRTVSTTTPTVVKPSSSLSVDIADI